MGFPGKAAVMVEEKDQTPAEPAGVEAEDASAGANVLLKNSLKQNP